VLGPASEAKARRLLDAPDPLSMLADLETGRPFAPATIDSSAKVEAIAANNAMLALLTGGRPATPLLLARDAGGRPLVSVGLPPDWERFAASVR
jgi:hypothetical protein